MSASLAILKLYQSHLICKSDSECIYLVASNGRPNTKANKAMSNKEDAKPLLKLYRPWDNHNVAANDKNKGPPQEDQNSRAVFSHSRNIQEPASRKPEVWNDMQFSTRYAPWFMPTQAPTEEEQEPPTGLSSSQGEYKENLRTSSRGKSQKVSSTDVNEGTRAQLHLQYSSIESLFTDDPWPTSMSSVHLHKSDATSSRVLPVPRSHTSLSPSQSFEGAFASVLNLRPEPLEEEEIEYQHNSSELMQSISAGDESGDGPRESELPPSQKALWCNLDDSEIRDDKCYVALHHFAPANNGIAIKIANIPWNSTADEVRQFLGLSTGTIYFMMDRTSGKTGSECFAEVTSMNQAQEIISRKNSQVMGLRTIELEYVASSELMRAIFPRWKGTWHGSDPVSPTSNDAGPGPCSQSSLPVFITKEEINSLINHARAYKSPYSRRCPERPYESFSAALNKFPWHLGHMYSVGHRDYLFESLLAMTRLLKNHIRSAKYSRLDNALMKRFIELCTIRAAFTGSQLFKLYRLAGMEIQYAEAAESLFHTLTPASVENRFQALRQVTSDLSDIVTHVTDLMEQAIESELACHDTEQLYERLAEMTMGRASDAEFHIVRAISHAVSNRHF